MVRRQDSFTKIQGFVVMFGGNNVKKLTFQAIVGWQTIFRHREYGKNPKFSFQRVLIHYLQKLLKSN